MQLYFNNINYSYEKNNNFNFLRKAVDIFNVIQQFKFPWIWEVPTYV